MLETINIEQAVLNNLRMLPDEKQQEVLNFIEFVVQSFLLWMAKTGKLTMTNPKRGEIWLVQLDPTRGQ